MDEGSVREQVGAMQQNGSGDGNTGAPEASNPIEKTPLTTLVIVGAGVSTGLLGEFLKSQGHAVLTAASSTDALAKTRRFLPAFILLSCDIEGVNSAELMSELLLEHTRAAVIMMAAKFRLWDVVDAIKMGAVDYLEWPLDLRRLKSAIDTQKDLFRGR
ncbi:MAG TPA: response regulator [bacterium]|jgi:DNA-binding NtrC family response regulator|nr:response regulator [bacterium]